MDHLRIVFKVLRENSLYVKKKKKVFLCPTRGLLPWALDRGRQDMDGEKVQAIRNWEFPTKVTEIILGLS